MKSWKCSAIIIAISFLCAAHDCLGTALPHLRIAELVSQSDVVVVADVSKLKEIGTTSIPFNGNTLPGERANVDAITLCPLAGSCPDQFTVEFDIPFSGVGYLEVKHATRIPFLKKSGSIFVPANPYYPDLPGVRTAPPELQGKNTSDQLIAELGAVIASADAGPDEKVEILGRSYAIPDDEGFLKDLLAGARNTANPDVRSRIQSILLTRNDISHLQDVCDTLLTGNITASQKEMLLYGIGYGPKNESALPELARLVQAPDPEVSVASAKGLWHTASNASIPVLMRALDDENPDVRYFAIRGLADATGQPQLGPSPAAHEGHEAEYRLHWLDWANKN